MKRKELAKTFMMISNWKNLWSPRFIQKYFSAVKVKAGFVHSANNVENIWTISDDLSWRWTHVSVLMWVSQKNVPILRLLFFFLFSNKWSLRLVLEQLRNNYNAICPRQQWLSTMLHKQRQTNQLFRRNYLKQQKLFREVILADKHGLIRKYQDVTLI